MKQSANLDFMRSVAVLLVVYAHIMIFSGHIRFAGWTGTTGVCLFFVHTSLVLMWSLERDPNVGAFYLRRIFRIYPLWLAVLFLTLLFHIPISPLFAPNLGFYRPGLRELLYQITLLFNLSPFAGASVVGASWSLPPEVDMYLLLPFLFFFVRYGRSLWPLLALDAFVLAWNRHNYGAEPIGPIFPICIPYFLGGVIAYQRSKHALKRLPAWSFPCFIAFLAVVTYHYGTYGRQWLLCLTVGLLVNSFQEITWRPLVHASHLLARYSYGVYLSHMIALAVSLRGFHNRPLVLRAFVFLFAVSALSFGFYHLVEKPMIQVGARLAKRVGLRATTKVTERDLNLQPAP